MTYEEKVILRRQIASGIMQNIVNTDSSWISKALEEVFYKRIAKHSVNCANALIKGVREI